MDLIKRFDCVQDADLKLCEHRGIAYQSDMTARRVSYGDDYLIKVDAYEGTPIAKAVNAGRCAMLARHLLTGARVLDVGAGSGAFVRAAQAAGYTAKGFEVIPAAAERLRAAGAYSDAPGEFSAVTLWDTIEHLENPQVFLHSVPRRSLLFVSLPIFKDLKRIRASKHYRPGEHLCYWTETGFVDWIALYGFRLLERSSHETEAGRESIGAFAFCRDLPDYHDHIAAYKEMHSTRHYGSSATELHLDAIAEVVRLCSPRSILDYGCGRSDLAAHFWLDGKRRIARYDPAIPPFKVMPEGRFELCFCLDVMEHIPMADVDRVLKEVRAKSDRAVFTISTKLARAKLPDGRNAHVTLLTKTEWIRWVSEYFGSTFSIKSEWEHELILFADVASARVMAA